MYRRGPFGFVNHFNNLMMVINDHVHALPLMMMIMMMTTRAHLPSKRKTPTDVSKSLRHAGAICIYIYQKTYDSEINEKKTKFMSTVVQANDDTMLIDTGEGFVELLSATSVHKVDVESVAECGRETCAKEARLQ